MYIYIYIVFKVTQFGHVGTQAMHIYVYNAYKAHATARIHKDAIKDKLREQNRQIERERDTHTRQHSIQALTYMNILCFLIVYVLCHHKH